MVCSIVKPTSEETKRKIAEIEAAINKQCELTGDNGSEEPPLLNIIHDYETNFREIFQGRYRFTGTVWYTLTEKRFTYFMNYYGDICNRGFVPFMHFCSDKLYMQYLLKGCSRVKRLDCTMVFKPNPKAILIMPTCYMDKPVVSMRRAEIIRKTEWFLSAETVECGVCYKEDKPLTLRCNCNFAMCAGCEKKYRATIPHKQRGCLACPNCRNYDTNSLIMYKRL
jgi:hypothetical protein